MSEPILNTKEAFDKLFPEVNLFPEQEKLLEKAMDQLRIPPRTMFVYDEAEGIDMTSFHTIPHTWAKRVVLSGPFPPCENFFKKIEGADEPTIVTKTE